MGDKKAILLEMEKQLNLTEVTELLTIADRHESDGPPGITTRAAALKDGL